MKLFCLWKSLLKCFLSNRKDDEDIFAEDDVPNSAVDLLNKDKVRTFLFS